MAIQDEEWDESKKYWENWLDNFEKHILPIFQARGYIKNTALMVYALACDPSSTIDELDEGDNWKDK